MANLKDWMLEAADGEEILAVVIGEDPHILRGVAWFPLGAPKEKIISWQEAIPWIDYKFSDGFGTEGCHSIYAWTSTKLIAISCYDGSTSWFTVPRNPVDCNPTMPGGG